MASAKGQGSESEPATEPAGTEQKRLRLFLATRNLWSQPESRSPGIETNGIAASFPPTIKDEVGYRRWRGELCEPLRAMPSNARQASQSSALQVIVSCISQPVD